MDKDKMKEGFSVKEIEGFTRKHRLEVFLVLSFLLATIFGYVFLASFTIAAAGIGGILGAVFPGKVELFSKKILHFVFKQERTTQIVFGIVMLILSIFLPFLTFFWLGLHGGKGLHHLTLEVQSQHRGE